MLRAHQWGESCYHDCPSCCHTCTCSVPFEYPRGTPEVPLTLSLFIACSVYDIQALIIASAGVQGSRTATCPGCRPRWGRGCASTSSPWAPRTTCTRPPSRPAPLLTMCAPGWRLPTELHDCAEATLELVVLTSREESSRLGQASAVKQCTCFLACLCDDTVLPWSQM